MIDHELTGELHRLVTLFLYMVAELSAINQIVNALTGLNGLPVVLVEVAVTTIYTCELSQKYLESIGYAANLS